MVDGQDTADSSPHEGEYWDLLDVRGIPTGRRAKRATDGSPGGSLLKPGEWHRVVQVCVINSHGEMLVQLRSENKPDWPGVWDMSAGGSVLAGETSGQGASRELMEEVGIQHDFTNQRPDVVISIQQGFFDVYVIRWDGDLSSLNLQTEEVADVRWATRQQLISMIDEGSFYPYPASLIDLIFTIHDHPESVRSI